MRELRIDGEGDLRRGPSPDGLSLITTKRDPAVAQRKQDHSLPRAVVRTQEGTAAYPSIEEAWKAVRRRQDKAAIDLTLGDGDAATQNDRLLAMNDCAEDGQLVATRDAAFALLAADGTVRIESAGEMRWAGGRMPLYLVSQVSENQIV